MNSKKLMRAVKAQTKDKQKRQLSEDDLPLETSEPARPILRFSPTAWAKLLYFRDKSGDEVGGFGITEPDDLLFVKEFATIKQEVTCVGVKFDDTAVGEFFDKQVDLGRRPGQFARIWCHTHPDMSPKPSSIDEQTFRRVFGACEWAVMFILACDDRVYARLSFNVGPGGHVLAPTVIDYATEFGPADHQSWDAEYSANVRAVEWFSGALVNPVHPGAGEAHGCAVPYDFIEEFENMEPTQRQLVLDELAGRPELWDEEGEVMLL